MLSKRASTAVDILRQGGKFVYILELNNYNHRSQFKAKLYDPNAELVKGISFSVFNELKDNNKLRSIYQSMSGTYTEYVLDEKV